MTPTILIVGAGFSGVALTHGLSRLGWPGGVRIVLADRSGTFGRGAAYSTDHPSHLLNVPAGLERDDLVAPGFDDDVGRGLRTRVFQQISEVVAVA